jgi:acetaldehyde dehydrogenase/alcohol dehydrogenase
VLLPYVIEYNAQKPTKFVSFPKYEIFIADKKYAEIAKALDLPSSTSEEGVQSLINAVKQLMKAVNVPASIAECKVDEKEFHAKVAELADKAFEDQCTTANPRLPLVSELEKLYLKAFKGETEKVSGKK